MQATRPAGGGRLPSLEQIDLATDRTTAVGLTHLKSLRHLRHLDFYNCDRIDDQALKQLATLRDLRFLNSVKLMSATQEWFT